MNEITFLEKDQVVGKKQLKILKKYGGRCIITDFAVLLNGYPTRENNKNFGWYWTKSFNANKAVSVTSYGELK